MKELTQKSKKGFNIYCHEVEKGEYAVLSFDCGKLTLEEGWEVLELAHDDTDGKYGREIHVFKPGTRYYGAVNAFAVMDPDFFELKTHSLEMLQMTRMVFNQQ